MVRSRAQSMAEQSSVSYSQETVPLLRLLAAVAGHARHLPWATPSDLWRPCVAVVLQSAPAVCWPLHLPSGLQLGSVFQPGRICSTSLVLLLFCVQNTIPHRRQSLRPRLRQRSELIYAKMVGKFAPLPSASLSRSDLARGGLGDLLVRMTSVSSMFATSRKKPLRRNRIEFCRHPSTQRH